MIYLYILSFVGIIITVVSVIGLLNLVLKEYVFQVNTTPYYPIEFCRTQKNLNGENPTPEEIAKCEQEQIQRDKDIALNDIKRDLSNNIAGFVVGLPLWLYHWGLIRKEKEEE